MVCNTGVGLTPTIDGEVHHFEARGFFDGVSILWDRESGTYWHHITGEALHGPLEGRQLPTYNLLHSTVEEALESHPDLEVAISARPIRRPSRWMPLVRNITMLSDRFRNTMAGEDARLPTLEVGLGIWEGREAKFYPMEEVMSRGRVIFDRFQGRRMVIYYQKGSYALRALYTDAEEATWDGDDLVLAPDLRVTDGGLVNSRGERKEIDRPAQVFTRWYGFALTFPGTEIYQADD